MTIVDCGNDFSWFLVVADCELVPFCDELFPRRSTLSEPCNLFKAWKSYRHLEQWPSYHSYRNSFFVLNEEPREDLDVQKSTGQEGLQW